MSAPFGHLWGIFRAGRVTRWHCNPAVAMAAPDPVDGHAGRVARLICALWPDASAALIRAALAHDDGEGAVGDLAWPVKRRMRIEAPEVLGAVEAFEAAARVQLHGEDPVAGLDPVDAERLAFADRLDAAMWVAAVAPAQMERAGWQRDLDRLADAADRLGLGEAMVDFISTLPEGWRDA